MIKLIKKNLWRSLITLLIVSPLIYTMPREFEILSTILEAGYSDSTRNILAQLVIQLPLFLFVIALMIFMSWRKMAWRLVQKPRLKRYVKSQNERIEFLMQCGATPSSAYSTVLIELADKLVKMTKESHDVVLDLELDAYDAYYETLIDRLKAVQDLSLLSIDEARSVLDCMHVYVKHKRFLLNLQGMELGVF